MILKAEGKKHDKRFADLIDYFALVGDGIVLTSTGVYVAGWEFAGQDMDSLGVEDCWEIANRIANKLRLGSGWTIHCDLIRREHQEYCPETSNWPDPVSYLIERERRGRFALTGTAAPRLSRYFLALSYEPEVRSARQAARWLFSSEEKGEGAGAKALDQFEKGLAAVDSLLRSNLRGVRRLQSKQCPVGDSQQLCDEFLQYIRYAITSEDYPFAIPEDPSFLNQYFATDDFTGGAEPQLGDPLNELIPGKHIAVLAIDGFPEKSFTGILRELDALPFDFRYCQQAQLLDEQEAKDKHQANMSKWSFRKSPPLKRLSPIKVGDNNVVVDSFAAEMELDARRAMSLAEHGKETFVRFSAKVILMESDPEKIKLALEAIVRTVKYHCGFSCRLESINAVAAWLASFPGQHSKDQRTFLINTQNMVHMMPLSAPFRGHASNPSKYFPPNSPPLFYAVTSGGTPYRFHSHVSDVGHQLIVGPTGSGKTTWQALGITQFFRYPNAQVFAFDKKKTLYTLSKAMGGDFYEISPDNKTTQLCPLQDLGTQRERDWAAQWIELLLDQNDLKVTPAMRNQIKTTIKDLSGASHQRSLTDFYMAVNSIPVKEALEFYLDGILDGSHDTLSMSRFCVFEMDELYRLDKKTMNGALFYIFARIQRRLSSSIPTLVAVDEFREALSHPMAAKYFDDFLYEGRKLNMSVWLVLQDLSKVLASPLAATVLQQCHTKVCLPNPQAIAEGAADYETLGLNARDREMIAHAEPKAEYYVTSPDGKRMIALELGQVALSFLAASDDDHRALVDALIKRDGDGWPAAWLRLRGLSDWSDLYKELALPAKERAAYA